MKRLFGVALLLIASILLAIVIAKKVGAQEIPGLTEVSGFVCMSQSDAESIGKAYELKGKELAGEVAQSLAEAGKCGTLKQAMWAIQKEVKHYQYQGAVIHLMEYDIEGTKVYGLLDKGEVLA